MTLLHGTGHFHVHQLMGDPMTWLLNLLLVWILGSLLLGLVVGPLLKRNRERQFPDTE